MTRSGIENGTPVGLFDRLTRKSTSFQPRRSSRALYVDYDFDLGSIQLMDRYEPVEPPADARWYGPGENADVAGLTIPGGLVYVGQYLPSPAGWNEPSLIDPTVRVNRRNPDRTGKHLSYWLTYDSIPPTSRGAYLEWLADGRRSPSTPIGYVFLFMYGLERRVLVDILENDAPMGELPAIREEMAVLLDTYGSGNVSFQSHAREFIGLIDLMTGDTAMDVAATPPPLTARTWSIPMDLRIALGLFAARKQPVPAEWALAWGWYNPEIPQRTPMTRCTDAFSRLFPIRYRERFGDGLVVRPGKRRVSFAYRPASAALLGGSMELDSIPEVFHHKGPAGKLALCFAGVSAELDAYSRWIGGAPERARMLPALARLPTLLIDDSIPEIRRFRIWLNDQLNGESRAVLTGEAVIAQWQPSGPDRLSKADATFLAQMLEHLGFGIEPDVRFGGQPLAAQRPAVLFRLEGAATRAATPAYSAASVLAHLAAAVSGAGDTDGIPTSREASRLSEQVSAVLHLTGPERSRLDAHVALLGAADVKLTGLTKRLDDLGETGRTAIGEILVGLATDGGMVSPAKVTMLMKVYRMLKLDPASVPGHLHAVMTESRPGPAREPVLVRAAGAGEPGYRIPSREERTGGSAPGGDLALDQARIEARLADSEAVSVLLGSIFAEPEDDRHRPEALPGRQGATVTDVSESLPEIDSRASDEVSLAGLDPAHSRLLRELVVRDAWTKAEFDALAARYHLMPDGALDTLNEAALDAVEEPLIEGDELLTINPGAVQELVA